MTKKNNNEEVVETPEVDNKTHDDDIPWRVYLAHSLSTWGDNMWWFAGGVFMLHLQDQDLRLTAIYGLVIAASVIIFGASLGKWIDRTHRLFAAKTFLVIQNTCVTGCALILSGFIGYREQLEYEVDYIWTLLVSVSAIVLASVARLASSGINIIIQKDWIVIISNNNNDKLARMNSILRTIELTTYMLAPAAGGFLFSYIGDVGTGIFIAVWNIVSVCAEFTLLTLIYKKHPKLAEVKINDEEAENDVNANKEKRNVIKDTVTGWKTYLTHPVRNAGIGLACLYMTVLGFDNITYGYCLLQGVPHFALGILVGISALVGVLGSLAYPLLREKVGIERSGLFGMFFLISTSSLAVISVFLPGSPMTLSWFKNTSLTNFSLEEEESTTDINKTLTFAEFISNYCSVSVFLLGIILARFGLWIVDLTINQILQENVEENVRGTVNGVQDSLNNTFDLIKCILVIFLPDKETFAFLIFLSYASINIGWFLYSLYSHQQRGHLFHFSKIIKVLLPSCMKPQPQNSHDNGSVEERDTFVKKSENIVV